MPGDYRKNGTTGIRNHLEKRCKLSHLFKSGDKTQSILTNVTMGGQAQLVPTPLINKGFKLLNWWKGNEGRYPILSKIANDIFAISSSAVASENAFSLGKRIVDPFRSSLTPKMVEALVYVAGTQTSTTTLPP
ncbi:unnamed protein product [Prunus brigantina]